MLLAVMPKSAVASGSSLAIREIKITGDEFVVLQNDGADINNLSDYWLGYVGDDSATPPPIQQLPDRTLPAGGVLLLSGGGVLDTCDASLVIDLSPTLSDTKGSLALWQQTTVGFEYLPGNQAKTSWSKSGSSSAVPAGEIDLKAQTSPYAEPVWYFDDAKGWSLGDFVDCRLVSYQSSSTGTIVHNWPANDEDPPAVIISAADDQLSPAGIPAVDQGLKPLQITELLPNPGGTGNDDTDEFIELYNPNDSTFDLNGFTLETGLSTKHKYTFSSGTTILPKSFGAFYSEDTGLSLSNIGSQATLVDPLGMTISSSDIYSSAKDGQAWALADGQWLWSSQPTPGKTNVVSQGASGSSKSSGTSTKTAGSVRGASTQGGSASSASFGSATQPAPIHAWTLAGVGGAALLYAGYEYRTELANNLYRVRRYFAARRASGK